MGFERRFNEIVSDAVMNFFEKKLGSNTIEAFDSHLLANGSSLKAISNDARLLKRELFVMFKAGAESIEAELIRAIYCEFGFQTQNTDLEEAIALLRDIVQVTENEGADSLSENRINNISKQFGHNIFIENKLKLKLFKCKDCSAFFMFPDDVEHHKKEKNHVNCVIEPLSMFGKDRGN